MVQLGDRQNQDRETEIEDLKDVHSAALRRLSARPISCAVAAPDNWTRTQMAMSLSASSRLPARGRSPSTMRPRPRLSALVKACSRVSELGKRRSPTVPAKKKNAPAPIAARLKGRAPDSSVLGLQRFGAVRLGAVDKGDRGEGREKREAERNVLDAGDRRRRRNQQERSDAAGAEQLDSHHPVEVAGSPQHPKSPAATVSRIKPAATRRTSFIAKRPHEESLLARQILRDGLSHVEAVNEERVLVHSDRQGARHEARERGERIAADPRRQTQRRRHESSRKSSSGRKARLARPIPIRQIRGRN